MKYQVERLKFIQYLKDNPSIIKMAKNLDEELCLTFIRRHTKENENDHKYNKSFLRTFFINLPDHLKTVKVSRAYFKIASKKDWLIISELPKDYLNDMTAKERKELIECRSDAIELLSNTTAEEWLLAVSKEYNGYTDIDKIPANFWSEELLKAVVSQQYFDGTRQEAEHYNIPGLWNKRLALDVAAIDPSSIMIMPKHLIDTEVLSIAINHNESYNLLRGDLNVPDEAWTLDLVKEAVGTCGDVILKVPKFLITEEVRIIAARSGCIPDIKKASYEVAIAYTASHAIRSWTSHGIRSWMNTDECFVNFFSKIKDKEKIVFDILAEASSIDSSFNTCFENFKSLDITLNEDLWIKIFKLYPTCIQHLEKINQTKEMVDAFFSAASIETMDRMAQFINLNKIKAEHTPLMVGCESAILTEVMNKYLRGDNNEAAENLIELEMAPSAYAKIKKELNRPIDKD